MAIIKASLSSLNPIKLILFTRNVLVRMSTNPAFTDPQPTLLNIQTKLTELEDLTQVAVDGSREDRLRRDICAEELKGMMRTLSNYVAMIAEGNGLVILSSGFKIRNQAIPAPPVAIPTSLLAQRSSYRGVVEVKWEPVDHANSYQVMMTSTDPNDETAEWDSAAVSSKTKAKIHDLTPGTYYWFKVKSIGSSSESGFSDPATIMAA